MEDFVYYGQLCDLYHELLTEKQKKYFKDYYLDYREKNSDVFVS